MSASVRCAEPWARRLSGLLRLFLALARVSSLPLSKSSAVLVPLSLIEKEMVGWGRGVEGVRKVLGAYAHSAGHSFF